MKLFQDDLIKNFPDCYNKKETSNNYKLMQLIQYDRDKFRSVLDELWKSLDIDNADTYTLNLYGDMVGQQRGLSTDEQYVLLIKTKIARNRCRGNYDSIVDTVCRILNCQPSEVFFEEQEEPATVIAKEIPLDKIIHADLSPTQFTQILKSILPAGITLETSVYEGSFAFADTEGVVSASGGFCQNEGDTNGGYFGVLSDEDNKTILPI